MFLSVSLLVLNVIFSNSLDKAIYKSKEIALQQQGPTKVTEITADK
jgi:hypothetical protein